MKTREERREELIKTMETTGIMMKDKYHKSELEYGYRQFQEMLVRTVFDEKHAESLRITDVEAHLHELAKERGVEDSTEMKTLDEQIGSFKKLIAHEIAGNKGERVVARC